MVELLDATKIKRLQLPEITLRTIVRAGEICRGATVNLHTDTVLNSPRWIAAKIECQLISAARTGRDSLLDATVW